MNDLYFKLYTNEVKIVENSELYRNSSWKLLIDTIYLKSKFISRIFDKSCYVMSRTYIMFSCLLVMKYV